MSREFYEFLDSLRVQLCDANACVVDDNSKIWRHLVFVAVDVYGEDLAEDSYTSGMCGHVYSQTSWKVL